MSSQVLSSNTAIFTHHNGTFESQQIIYSVYVPTAASYQTANLFCFIGKTDAWANNDYPEVPRESDAYLKQVRKNMIYLKRILLADMTTAIERIDWTSGTSYSAYDDDEDMFEEDIDGTLVKKWYVRNSYDQIFICIANNEGGVSTVEPKFEVTSTDRTVNLITADGYVWKYISSIPIGLKQKFMDDKYIPYSKYATKNMTQYATIGAGQIEHVRIANTGSGYANGNTTVTMTINGDGSNAEGYIVIQNNEINNVVLTNQGSDYTNATITITSTSGQDGQLYPVLSPIGGHGFDPLYQLGMRRLMMVSEFDKTEGSELPTDFSFRQVGLILDPVAPRSGGERANTYAPLGGDNYKMYTQFSVSPGLGVYTPGETVYQGLTLDTATYKATVVSYDSANLALKVINTYKTHIETAPIIGATSGVVRVLINTTYPESDMYLGNITYIENRTPVQRTALGTEKIKLTIKF